jgi:hypothetical protein
MVLNPPTGPSPPPLWWREPCGGRATDPGLGRGEPGGGGGYACLGVRDAVGVNRRLMHLRDVARR